MGNSFTISEEPAPARTSRFACKLRLIKFLKVVVAQRMTMVTNMLVVKELCLLINFTSYLIQKLERE